MAVKHGHTLNSSILATEDYWLQKLIGFALLVSLLDGLGWVAALLAVANYHAFQRNFDSLPSLVAIHGIVSTHDSCDFADSNFFGLIQEALHETSTRFRINVTSVAEEVDIDMRDFKFFGNLQESVEMILLGVLTTWLAPIHVNCSIYLRHLHQRSNRPNEDGQCLP
jgi:hypothetical protein